MFEITMLDEDSMANDGLTDQERDKIIGILQALFPGIKVYLYGSRARKEFREFSDIDIALDAEHKLDYIDVGEARNILNASNFPYNFDVVDYQSISSDFKNIIDSEKIIWKN
jgi:predicted nucleotidyltransferase